MTKSKALALAYAQHPSTRGNGPLHRSAAQGDATPALESLLLPPQLSSHPEGEGLKGQRSRSASPGSLRSERSRSRSRSGPVRSPADKLRAASGCDVEIPAYIDDEQWSWNSRRRRIPAAGGRGRGELAVPSTQEEEEDDLGSLLGGQGGSEGFIGWPPRDANAHNAAGEAQPMYCRPAVLLPNWLFQLLHEATNLPITLTTLTVPGETPLHRAAGCRGEAAPSWSSDAAHVLPLPPGGGGLAVMAHLLALGADPGARDARGLTPLMTIFVKGETYNSLHEVGTYCVLLR